MNICYRGFLYEAQDRILRNTYDAILSKYSEGGQYVSHKDLYVSFTSIPKIGINPKSEWGTPNGIYTYPLDYYIEVENDTGVPYKGEDPRYVNILRASGNIVNLSKYTMDEYRVAFDSIVNILRKNSKIEEYISLEDSSEFFDAIARSSLYDTPGGLLWNLTRISSMLLKCRNVSDLLEIWNTITNDDYDVHGIARIMADIKLPRFNNTWQTLFRELGIDGVLDTGYGIIHSNEKVQAVFFTINVVALLDRFNYRDSKVFDPTTKMSVNEFSDMIDLDNRLLQYIPKYIVDNNSVSILNELSIETTHKLHNNLELCDKIIKTCLKIDSSNIKFSDLEGVYALSGSNFEGREICCRIIDNIMSNRSEPFKHTHDFMSSPIRYYLNDYSRNKDTALCSIQYNIFQSFLDTFLKVSPNSYVIYKNCNNFKQYLSSNPHQFNRFNFKSDDEYIDMLEKSFDHVLKSLSPLRSKEISSLVRRISMAGGNKKKELMSRILQTIAPYKDKLPVDLVDTIENLAQ